MLAVGALPRLYLHWEFYQPGMENMGKQMSPLHFLKLKKGVLAAILGGSVMAWPGLAWPGLAWLWGALYCSVLWALSPAAAAWQWGHLEQESVMDSLRAVLMPACVLPQLMHPLIACLPALLL
jgi:hypothetical protein